MLIAASSAPWRNISRNRKSRREFVSAARKVHTANLSEPKLAATDRPGGVDAVSKAFRRKRR
jgi:hypothetical protein